MFLSGAITFFKRCTILSHISYSFHRKVQMK